MCHVKGLYVQEKIRYIYLLTCIGILAYVGFSLAFFLRSPFPYTVLKAIKNIQNFERKSAASWLKKVFLNLLNFYSPNEAAIVFFENILKIHYFV